MRQDEQASAKTQVSAREEQEVTEGEQEERKKKKKRGSESGTEQKTVKGKG